MGHQAEPPRTCRGLGVNALVDVRGSIGDYDMYKDVVKSLCVYDSGETWDIKHSRSAPAGGWGCAPAAHPAGFETVPASAKRIGMS